MKIEQENLGGLSAVLHVYIEENDYQPLVNEGLKKIRKTANVPGFRIGYVPEGLIKRQYGKSIKVDEINKLFQESINKYLRDSAVSIVAAPILREDNEVNWDANNFTFSADIGLAPEVPLLFEEPKVSLPYYRIIVDSSLLEKELLEKRRNAGSFTEGETVQENSIVQFSWSEIMEQNHESQHEHKGRILVADFEIFKSAMLGKAINDEVEILFEEHTDKNEMAEILDVDVHHLEEAKGLKCTIIAINQLDIAEANETFFNEYFEVNTEEEAREILKARLQSNFDQASDQRFLDEVYRYLIENLSFEMPKNFLMKWLSANREGGLSPEAALEEYNRLEPMLKWDFIVQKAQSAIDINISDEELNAFIYKDTARMYSSYNLGPDFLNYMVQSRKKNEEDMDKMYRTALTEKTLFVLSQNFDKNEKWISLKEFNTASA